MAPTLTSSTKTLETLYPSLGVMLKVTSSPVPTATSPLGLMVPFSPAEAEITNAFVEKLATMVWFSVTFSNV